VWLWVLWEIDSFFENRVLLKTLKGFYFFSLNLEWYYMHECFLDEEIMMV